MSDGYEILSLDEVEAAQHRGSTSIPIRHRSASAGGRQRVEGGHRRPADPAARGGQRQRGALRGRARPREVHRRRGGSGGARRDARLRAARGLPHRGSSGGRHDRLRRRRRRSARHSTPAAGTRSPSPTRTGRPVVSTTQRRSWQQLIAEKPDNWARPLQRAAVSRRLQVTPTRQSSICAARRTSTPTAVGAVLPRGQRPRQHPGRPALPGAARVNLAHIDDLDAIEMPEGFTWRPVRRHFGIRAFGTNAYTPGAQRTGRRGAHREPARARGDLPRPARPGALHDRRQRPRARSRSARLRPRSVPEARRSRADRRRRGARSRRKAGRGARDLGVGVRLRRRRRTCEAGRWDEATRVLREGARGRTRRSGDALQPRVRRGARGQARRRARRISSPPPTRTSGSASPPRRTRTSPRSATTRAFRASCRREGERRRPASAAPAPDRPPAAPRAGRRRAPPRARASRRAAADRAASANALCACSPPNGTSSSSRREPGDDVAPGDRAHRDVGDDRLAVAARDPDRERIRAGELRPALRMAETGRRGRGQDADEPAVGEPADVVAEHPGGERPLADDEARVRGRPLELRAHDPPEDEVADRAAAVPALEALVLLEQRRLGSRVVALELLEPRDPRVAVSLLAALLGSVEVRPQLLRVGLSEAERAQPAQALVSVHGTSSRAGPRRRPRRRPRAQEGRGGAHEGRRAR